MQKTALKGNVILEDKVLSGGVVLIEGEKISAVNAGETPLEENDVSLIDYKDNFISPGLIDLHLHGALGKDVMDGEVKSLEQIASHQARHGVTGFLGTIMSASLDSMLKAVEAVKKAKKLQLSSEILGVHIEGVYSSLRRKGAQDPDFIREMKQEEIQLLIQAFSGLKTIISMAPEVKNNRSFIKPLTEKGAVVSIGHSDATYDEALESFEEGISHATHLFNAMSGYHHREPGVIGAVLDSSRVTAEVIADGLHIFPSALRLALAAKGYDKICLITDSIMAAGLGDGIYQMGNLEVVLKGYEARLRKSGTLAGSVLTLNKAVKNAFQWTGMALNQAVNLASLNPSRVIGLDHEMGSIQEGKYANLVVLDEEFNVLETYLKGRSVFKP
jgi:N-acetylglucosamine-6-phosphate deacetylase